MPSRGPATHLHALRQCFQGPASGKYIYAPWTAPKEAQALGNIASFSPRFWSIVFNYKASHQTKVQQAAGCIVGKDHSAILLGSPGSKPVSSQTSMLTPEGLSETDRES